MATPPVVGGDESDDAIPFLPPRSTPSAGDPPRPPRGDGAGTTAGTGHTSETNGDQAIGDHRIGHPLPTPQPPPGVAATPIRLPDPESPLVDSTAARRSTNTESTPIGSTVAERGSNSEWAPPTPSPLVFGAEDAVVAPRAVVARRIDGELPAPSAEADERPVEVREQAERKRRRDLWLTRAALVILIAGFGGLLFVVFDSADNGNDDRPANQAGPNDAAEPAPTPPTVASQSAAGATTPADAGSPSPATSAAVSAEVREPAEPSVATEPSVTVGTQVESLPVTGPITVSTVDLADLPIADALLSPVMVELAARLPDPSGRVTYVVPVAAFVAADEVAYQRFIEVVESHPQLAPDDPAFDGLPLATTDDIVVSVERDGDEVRRVLVVASGLGLFTVVVV